MKSRLATRILASAASFVILALLLAACGAMPDSPSTSAPGNESTSPQEQTTEEEQASQEEYERAQAGQGLLINFVRGQFYDQPIEDEEDAIAAVESAMDRMEADDTTKLELQEIRPTETGSTYYTFRQRAGDVAVHGATVKLVVDKDHKVAGLVSAILPNVRLADLESWEITAEQAQQVVQHEYASNGQDAVDIVDGATEQTLIALNDENAEIRRYAWVVYTNNYLDNVHAGYMAHYVSADGKYLYAIPVSKPGSAEALAGDVAAFEFVKMEEGTWSGTVTKRDGSAVDVEVPVLTDPQTGDVILADAKRKILCADFAAFEYNNGTIVPRTQGEDGFANNEVLIYDTFIKVWDFFDSIGWHGPDDEGTPTILKMDMVDKNGEVIRNASYSGEQHGFQTFNFNRIDADGECVDYVAHEFTHAVTGTIMTANLYTNDTGAINEGFSDIMGNLVEMSVAYSEDGAWLMGENNGTPERSMKDPHEHNQPEYVWDVYYGPAVAKSTVANDFGGAHINSSLLNLVSYKLDQAGMSVSDQVYFWMNVALALTPSTDYPQIAELLPWCMEQAGYPEYVDAVQKAVADTRLTAIQMPEVPPEGAGYLYIAMPEQIAVDTAEMRFLITPSDAGKDAEEIMAWVNPATDAVNAVVPAGEYTLTALYHEDDKAIDSFTLTDDGWVSTADGSRLQAMTVSVVAGQAVDLPSEGL